MSTARLDLAPFKILIQQRCGLVFSSGNDEKLESALRERMECLALGQFSTVAGRYLTRLRTDTEEFQALVNRLTINETYFFREPEQITLVVEHLLPRLLAEKPLGEPLRLLSAGCASGEEAYSLSIAIAERHGDSVLNRCQIVGVDIDSDIIAKAQRGVYTAFSFRGLSAEFRQRYFQPDSEANAYRIQDQYRRRVGFFQANLFADSPFEATLESWFLGSIPSFDIALMRNVSIYFDESGRRQLQHALFNQLSKQGLLVVGSAETLANDLGIFRLVEHAGHYYFTKEEQALPTVPVLDTLLSMTPAAPVTTPSTAPPPTPAVQPAAPAIAFSWQDISQRLERHEHQDAAKMLASLSPTQSEMQPFKVLGAYLALEEGRLDEAGEIAQKLLSDQPWFVDALFVQGLVNKLEQRIESAAVSFRRITYAQPACWPALFHLAECGEPYLGRELRLRAYRNVLRLSELDSATGLDYLPFVQQRTQIRQLARQRLVQLADENVGGSGHGH